MRANDAIVVGSGPNGLAAAIVLAEAGLGVVVYEAEPQIGGGARSGEVTLPGFTHDLCSAIHPFAVASPFFKTLPLGRYGLEWIEPPAMLAHPLDDGPAAMVFRSIAQTAEELEDDGGRYRRTVGAVVDAWPRIEPSILGPFGWPRHALAVARFGVHALRPASTLVRAFGTRRARALVAGLAAHGMLPLDRRPSAAFALVLAATAHFVGWPLPRGGAQAITNALAAHLRSLGGDIIVGARVHSIEDLPPARVVLCDLSPRPLVRIAGDRFPPRYRRALERYRYGMGVFKVDWALDAPVPWRDRRCAEAATVHLGGTFDEIARAERQAWEGIVPERPFVILSQPSLFDDSRAPAGQHTLWGYCHVPHASAADVLSRIEAQIERFAPGFGGRILARAITGPADLERHNANFVGGDIASGVTDLRQLFTRPTWRTYRTPLKGVYICSAATPPGVGVHGMCGYFAARLALSELDDASR